MRRFVVGDIHGNFKGLKQVLEDVNFDYENDQLISLGDIADGFPEVPECIEEFMKIKNLIWCVGNHDVWCQEWFSGKMDMKNVGPDGHANGRISSEADLWLSQGGRATFKAYMDKPELITKHRDFWLTKPQLYFESVYMELFLHAGYLRNKGVILTASSYRHHIYWDRNFFTDARRLGKDFDISPYTKVYIGHTSTTYFGVATPIDTGKVCNMDTGGGWVGCISLKNLDTGEVFQSYETARLYPNFRPRED